MRLKLLMFCILMFQIGFATFANDTGTYDETYRFKRRKISTYLELPSKREIYEQVHQKNYEQDKSISWPVLDDKESGQLANICQNLAKCVGISGWVLSVFTEIKILSYDLNDFKSITIVMLRCKIGKHIHRFIDGAENYTAFMALPVLSNPSNFFIAAACPRVSLPDVEVNLNPEEYTCTRYEEPSEKIFEYEAIHYSKYAMDIVQYKSWSIMENKSPQELSHIAMMLAACVGIDDLVKDMNVKLEKKYLRYSTYGYKPRLVKMLACYQVGKRSFYFIDGAADYKVFLVVRKGIKPSQNVFISAACASDTAPNEDYIDPSGDVKPIVPKLEIPPKDEDDESGPSIHTIHFF